MGGSPPRIFRQAAGQSVCGSSGGYALRSVLSRHRPDPGTLALGTLAVGTLASDTLALGTLGLGTLVSVSCCVLALFTVHFVLQALTPFLHPETSPSQ